MARWHSERQTLWEVTGEMVKQGLVAGSSGNASLRLPGDGDGGYVLITPSGRPYRYLAPEDMVVIDMDGGPVEGDLLPSSETAMHLELYKARQDVEAIIHTHSLYASVAAVSGLEIPPIVVEMVIRVGGSVRVAEYAFPSTEELAQNAGHALGDRNAVLLRNHGMVGVGRTSWEALDLCQMVERVAQIFVYSSLLGRALTLPSEIIEMEQELYRMQGLRSGTPRET
ncbi:MAG: class II aldolase/adducin family protein [Dehalococcoidia bacterium]|nr:class II aldolase/adducin family protein [Dehalococcoidia bacterium]